MVKDHKGNEFKNLEVMAKAYNISYNALYQRLKNNWDLEKALTTPVKKANKEKVSKNKKKPIAENKQEISYPSIAYKEFIHNEIERLRRIRMEVISAGKDMFLSKSIQEKIFELKEELEEIVQNAYFLQLCDMVFLGTEKLGIKELPYSDEQICMAKRILDKPDGIYKKIYH